MNTHVRIVVALLLGAFAFAVTTVAVTAGFEPQIEFSLLIGLPMGVTAGLTALFAGLPVTVVLAAAVGYLMADRVRGE